MVNKNGILKSTASTGASSFGAGSKTPKFTVSSTRLGNEEGFVASQPKTDALLHPNTPYVPQCSNIKPSSAHVTELKEIGRLTREASLKLLKRA